MLRKNWLVLGVLYLLTVGCDQLSLNTDGDPSGDAPGGMAVQFDGVDDYATVNAAAAALAGTDFTIEMWFRLLSDPDNDDGNAEVIFSADQDWDNQIQVFTSGTTTVGYHEWLSNSTQNFGFAVDALLGTWHHLAIRKEASQVTLLIDGKPADTITTTTAVQVASTLSLAMQRNNPTPAQFWNGEIDELRFWNVARSDAEISQNMTTELDSTITLTLDSGLVGYWRFEAQVDLGIGASGANDIEDESANVNHMDLSGATLVAVQM